ncbi:MAG: hypothetical protein QM479_02435 [Pseudomonadota bacterium]
MNSDSKLNILIFIIFLVISFASNAKEITEENELQKYYQVSNQNTILILKEKTTYFKRHPLNSLFVGNLKWSTDLESKIKKDLSFYKVISKKISETVSSKALQIVTKVIEDEKPKVIVIALGENDGLFSKTVKEIRQYLAAIIKTAQNSNAKVVLVGNQLPLHYGLQYTNSFVEMYANLAQLYNIAYVPEDKISYTYPLFLYSYSYYNQEKLPAQGKSGDKIWQEVDKIISKEKEKENNARLPDYYRYPEFLLGIGSYHKNLNNLTSNNK